jgi:ribosome-associated translation inhibitor RaiA
VLFWRIRTLLTEVVSTLCQHERSLIVTAQSIAKNKAHTFTFGIFSTQFNRLEISVSVPLIFIHFLVFSFRARRQHLCCNIYAAIPLHYNKLTRMLPASKRRRQSQTAAATKRRKERAAKYWREELESIDVASETVKSPNGKSRTFEENKIFVLAIQATLCRQCEAVIEG